MHFEILVEDQSGKKVLDVIVPKIIGSEHTFNVYSYRGIGRIPQGLNTHSDVRRRILLEQLPKLLRGYGNKFAGYPVEYCSVVILICDIDDKCLKAFREELFSVLHTCNPQPETRFCIAIEEGEAWLLGDIPAVKSAYPKAKDSVLNGYENDSICGTWEKLADAIYPKGASALFKRGWQSIGTEKSVWAEKISPHMDVTNNKSPSFIYFREKLRELTGNNV